MKTTVHIPDALLAEVQQLAQQEGTTLKALVREGLQRVVAERRSEPCFALRDASVMGRGLQPEMADASWEKLRDAIYAGRGG